MALITCSNCGKQFSDTVTICPHCGHDSNAQPVVCPECGHQYSSEVANCPKCGFKTQRKSKITIRSIVPGTVKISIEGRQVGTVEKKGMTTVEIDHDCIITFTRLGDTTSHAVKVGQKEQILLSVTGYPAVLRAFPTTEETYAQDSINMKEKNKKTIIVVIFVILLIFFFFLNKIHLFRIL